MPAADPPLVSIVVPVYNGARYLREALDSLLAQTHPRCEIIVVDDGSTDATPVVLDTYRERVVVYRQANAGQAAAMNAGWARSAGDVLSYLSADDRLRPDAVATVVRTLTAEPGALAVYGDYALIDPTSAVLGTVAAPPFEHWRVVAEASCPPGPGAFVRRAAHLAAGPWDETLRQIPDLDYWLRLGLLGPVVHIPAVLAEFREHDASATFRPATPARAEEPVAVYRRFFARDDLPVALGRLRRSALAHAHLVTARAHLRAGRHLAATRHLARATMHSPRAVFSARAARLIASGVVGAWRHRRRWSAA